MVPRGNRKNPPLSDRENELSVLPEAFKAFTDGWVDITDEEKAYKIELEDDFHRRGLPVEAIFIFEHLLGDGLNKIVDYTTTRLVDKGKSPTSCRHRKI